MKQLILFYIFMCSVFCLLHMNHFALKKNPLYQIIKTAVQTYREIFQWRNCTSKLTIRLAMMSRWTVWPWSSGRSHGCRVWSSVSGWISWDIIVSSADGKLNILWWKEIKRVLKEVFLWVPHVPKTLPEILH